MCSNKNSNQNREKEVISEERIQQKNGQKFRKQIESNEEKEIYFDCTGLGGKYNILKVIMLMIIKKEKRDGYAKTVRSASKE